MQDKDVRRDAFALFAKIAAVLVAVAAFAVIRLPEPPARLIIVAAPGAPRSWMEDADHGALPGLLSTGFAGSVRADASSSGSRFWRRLFDEDEPRGQDGLADGPAVWESFGSRVAVIGAPSRMLDGNGGARSAMMTRTETGFVGSSAGITLEAKDVAMGKVPPPYDRQSERIVAAAESLAEGRWSEWIALEGPQNGQFQIGRLSGSEIWLSPVYRGLHLGTLPPVTVLLGEPFVRGMQADSRQSLLEHLIAVQSTRSTAAERLLSVTSDARTVVLFDSLPSHLASMSAPDPPAGGNLQRVREELDSAVARLRAAAPGPSTVLVIGGPDLGRTAGQDAWYLLSDGSGQALREDLDSSQLRVLVRYLLGAPIALEQRRSIPPAVLARYPVRGAAEVVAAPIEPAQELPWSVQTLESLRQAPAGS